MLTDDFWKSDRHVAVYYYHYEGIAGLQKLKQEWLKEGKSKELLDYVDELIAKRPNDPERILYQQA
jgi:hypothetical protein